MPRISAPTVAEHRRHQREALLAAATELLVEGGVSAVTPGAVGAAAGLSRPAVYQYFASGPAILGAIIEDAFPKANAALLEVLDSDAPPAERIDTYLRETLRLAADGAHRAAAALSGAQLPEEFRGRLRELHREQAAPLMSALRELAAENPSAIGNVDLTAMLLGGVVEAAMRALEHGAPLAAVTRHTIAHVRGSLHL
ncbi:TetR family transcriptional regulator [Homoserinimonas aerilata]|uniref:TetR family transcriptional regulator n=1 Tax=Homoserinimonas aerilata TaxID=1162970 RepID=A0A542YH98_9MICO|nr:TetR/AcrR family transcriptional regulator [Homoserinimonas aerilata]TQL47475.1 TetR family transcriptional regulator [Homoserinimonas aerilata]